MADVLLNIRYWWLSVVGAWQQGRPILECTVPVNSIHFVHRFIGELQRMGGCCCVALQSAVLHMRSTLDRGLAPWSAWLLLAHRMYVRKSRCDKVHLTRVIIFNIKTPTMCGMFKYYLIMNKTMTNLLSKDKIDQMEQTIVQRISLSSGILQEQFPTLFIYSVMSFYLRIWHCSNYSTVWCVVNLLGLELRGSFMTHWVEHHAAAFEVTTPETRANKRNLASNWLG